MKKLDHPHIVRILEFFETNAYISIVMNKVNGKDLFMKCLETPKFST